MRSGFARPEPRVRRLMAQSTVFSLLPPVGLNVAAEEPDGGFDIVGLVLEKNQRAEGGEMLMLIQISGSFVEHAAKNVNRGAQCKGVNRVCEFRHSFFLSVGCCRWRGKSRAVMTPGSTGYTVARCGLPVDDGGRSGRLSRRVTTNQGKEFEIAAQCSGTNSRAA